MSDVIQVSSTEEYFAEDYGRVHCKHGTYIGYPGGADYICGPCEDGYNTFYVGIKAILRYRIWYADEQLWGLWNEIATSYSFSKCREWVTWYALFADSTFEYEIEIKWEAYQYWGPEDENV